MIPEETLDIIDPKALIGKKLVVVLGPTDVGKSTFIKRVYNALCKNYKVFILDTDVGQSDIGPPCTISLGTGEKPVDDLQELKILSLHFLGSTTPSYDTGDFIWGVTRVFEFSKTFNPDITIVNTTGWVDGDKAFSTKISKISLFRPDLIILVGSNMADYFRLFSSSLFDTIWVKPSVLSVIKDQETRRKNRLEKVIRFFSGKREEKLKLRNFVIYGDPGDISPRKDTGEVPMEAFLRDMEWRIIGFFGPGIRTIGIGWIQRVNITTGEMVVKTFFVRDEKPRFVKLGPKFVPMGI